MARRKFREAFRGHKMTDKEPVRGQQGLRESKQSAYSRYRELTEDLSEVSKS